MIPDDENFSFLLQSITTNEPHENKDDFEEIELFPPEPFVGNDNMEFTLFYRLWYPKVSKISYEGLIQKISKELYRIDHLFNREVAKSILLIYCSINRSCKNAVEILNNLFMSIKTVKIDQYCVLPLPLTNFSFNDLEVKGFFFGKCRAEKIRYDINYIGSDYGENYYRSLKDKLCIEKKKMPGKCIDKYSLGLIIGLEDIDSAYNAIQKYYNVFCDAYWDEFKKELVNVQHMQIAYSGLFIHEDLVSSVPGSIKLTILSNMNEVRRNGWCCPNQTSKSIDLCKIDERIPQVEAELKSKYDFDDYTNSKHSSLLNNYVLYVSKAKRHGFQEDWNEAFIHYIIAFELVFGDRESIQEKIAKRVAIISHHHCELSFDDQVKKIKELYAMRSRFIHEGKPITNPEDRLEEIGTIAHAVLICMLHIFQQEKDNDDINWIPNIDFCIAKRDAGRALDEDDYVSIGVAY